VSDHLFNPQGNKTTIAPKRIIAYIWDIISMHHHLLSVPHSPWHILHYKCCGQLVKIIDQKCLQSKIFFSNNEKIGILLNDKLTKKGKWIIGQKGKLPENMRSSAQPQPTSSVQVAYCSGDPSGKIKLAFGHPGDFYAISWQANCTMMKAAGLVDSFQLAGCGRGFTLSRSLVLWRRLEGVGGILRLPPGRDYIRHPPDLRCRWLRWAMMQDIFGCRSRHSLSWKDRY
jgi:hypothetical protein